jgi:hypothetical protein
VSDFAQSNDLELNGSAKIQPIFELKKLCEIFLLKFIAE